MAKLKIYSFPDQVLKEKAKPINRVDASYRKIADDMFETMYDAPGIGLAANQVGLLERIFVVDVDYETLDPDQLEEEKNYEIIAGVALKGRRPEIFINPEIIYREGEQTFNEGCLSVPDFHSEVIRAEKIKIKYQNIDGLEKILAADGLLAVCIQHELDHLNGKLFIDRLAEAEQKWVKKELLIAKKRKDPKSSI